MNKIKEFNRKKILLIDDDKDYLVSLQLFLEKKYIVVSVDNVNSARELIRTQPLDLVVLDAMMPETDGFKFVKELKSQPEYRTIPVIMLTGMVPKIRETKYSPDDILRFTGDEFIEKSAGIDEIVALIERYLI